MTRRCDNCKVDVSKCLALQSAGSDYKIAERREMQCADDFQAIDIAKPIFD